MDSLKGIVRRVVDGSPIAFRFANLTHYLYLQKMREDNLTDADISTFECRMYLFLAAIQAYAGNPVTKEDVFEIMDGMTDDEQVSVLEEGGQYLDFLGKLSLHLRSALASSEEHARVLRVGIETLNQLREYPDILQLTPEPQTETQTSET